MQINECGATIEKKNQHPVSKRLNERKNVAEKKNVICLHFISDFPHLPHANKFINHFFKIIMIQTKRKLIIF